MRRSCRVILLGERRISRNVLLVMRVGPERVVDQVAIVANQAYGGGGDALGLLVCGAQQEHFQQGRRVSW